MYDNQMIFVCSCEVIIFSLWTNRLLLSEKVWKEEE